MQKLRTKSIKAELFPGSAKMNKQMGYANAREIPYVALIGEEEMKQELISLKNMLTGEQIKVTFNELMEKRQLKFLASRVLYCIEYILFYNK